MNQKPIWVDELKNSIISEVTKVVDEKINKLEKRINKRFDQKINNLEIRINKRFDNIETRLQKIENTPTMRRELNN